MVSAIESIKAAFRIVLSALSLIPKVRRKMSRPLDNILISWWCERSLRPELVRYLRAPLSLDIPVDDEDLLVAMLILMQFQQGGVDPMGLLEGKLRPKLYHIVFGLAVLSFFIGLSALSRTSLEFSPMRPDEIAHGLFMMLPLMWVLMIIIPVAMYSHLLSGLRPVWKMETAVLTGSWLIVPAIPAIIGCIFARSIAAFTYGPAWHLVVVIAGFLVVLCSLAVFSAGATLGILLKAIHNERAVS